MFEKKHTYTLYLYINLNTYKQGQASYHNYIIKKYTLRNVTLLD